MDNANPIIYATQSYQPRDTELDAISNSTQWWRDDRLAPHATLFDTGKDSGDDHEEDPYVAPERLDAREVFDLVRSITDPEHPLTLEQLAVVKEEHITVDEGDAAAKRAPHILLEFTPTIPHCSMATLIGLSLRVRLLRALPSKYKVTIRIREGTHQSENAINKQLQDKERVAAALENKHLLGVVQGCLATSAQRGTGSTDMAQGSALLST